MKVSVCIASRGRPEQLQKTIRILTAGMTEPDTQIAVALDDDDDVMKGIGLDVDVTRIMFSVAPREDSLGAKYNRAQSQIRADLYVLWADDMTMPERDWDARLAMAAAQFSKEPGIVYFGALPGIFQPGIAVNHAMVEAMGFFCQPFTPYWWHDTWIDEVGRLSDRIIHADVRVELLNDVKGASRGVREIAFWGQFFDRLRPQRVAVAQNIIRREPLWRQTQLLERLPQLEAAVNERNRACSDPASAAQLESHYSFDAPADERYLRLRAKAEAMLKETT